MTVFDINTIYKAKVGEIHVEVEETYMRAEGDIMQEMGITWKEREAMREADAEVRNTPDFA
jgi:hypothetical protein